MADKRLEDYIDKQRAAGHSDSNIKETLLKEGWDKKEISDSLSSRGSGGNPKNSSTGYSGKGSKSSKGSDIGLKSIIIVMVIIAVIGIVIYLVYPSLLPLPPPGGPECGNGICETGENANTCPDDCSSPPPDTDQLIFVSPQTQTVSTGEQVAVEVRISDAASLYGFQFNLLYDESILDFSDAEEGTFLNEDGSADTFYMDPETPAPGTIKNVACSRKGQIGGVDGEGVLVVIKFNALSEGTSQLEIAGAMLSDSQVQSTSFTVDNGEIVVQ